MGAARLIMLGAQREAEARCTPLSEEHLLLALLALPQGAGEFLRVHGLTYQEWREHLPPVERFSSRETLFTGPQVDAPLPSTLALRQPIALNLDFVQWGAIPLSASCRRILELAGEEATRYGSHTIGSHHILLALLRMDDVTGNPSGRWLEARDVTYQTIRVATLQNLYRESLSLATEDHQLEDKPSAKLNTVAFLLPGVCVTSLLLAGGQLPLMSGFFACSLLVALCVALSIMILSRPQRLKSSIYWLLGGFFVSGVPVRIVQELLNYYHLIR